MAHILDGRWSSFTIRGGRVANDDKGPIDLEVDEGTGNLKSTSKQNGNTLTGKVTREGRFLTVEIVNAGDRRKFEGLFSADHSPGGVTDKSISGRITLNFVQLRDGVRDEASSDRKRKGEGEKESERFDQEQAIWVATKP